MDEIINLMDKLVICTNLGNNTIAGDESRAEKLQNKSKAVRQIGVNKNV